MELAGLEPATSWVRSRRSLARNTAWLGGFLRHRTTPPTSSPTLRSPFSSRTTPTSGDRAGDRNAGLSRRRSRVRVPSLRSEELCKSRYSVAGLTPVAARVHHTPPRARTGSKRSKTVHKTQTRRAKESVCASTTTPRLPTGTRRDSGVAARRSCQTRRQRADTKRTHQKRHPRRLATHPRCLIWPCSSSWSRELSSSWLSRAAPARAKEP
jgi:hypothetical protein